MTRKLSALNHSRPEKRFGNGAFKRLLGNPKSPKSRSLQTQPLMIPLKLLEFVLVVVVVLLLLLVVLLLLLLLRVMSAATLLNRTNLRPPHARNQMLKLRGPAEIPTAQLDFRLQLLL